MVYFRIYCTWERLKDTKKYALLVAVNFITIWVKNNIIWCISYRSKFKCSIYIIVFHIYILGLLFWILPCPCKQKNLYLNTLKSLMQVLRWKRNTNDSKHNRGSISIYAFLSNEILQICPSDCPTLYFQFSCIMFEHLSNHRGSHL